MGIGDDLTPFFRLKTDGGFADLATITPSNGDPAFTAPVIFDEYGIDGSPYSGNVQKFNGNAENWTVSCKTVDANLMTVGDTIEIDGDSFEIARRMFRSDDTAKLIFEPTK